jgi:hypothetical protein
MINPIYLQLFQKVSAKLNDLKKLSGVFNLKLVNHYLQRGVVSATDADDTAPF